VSATGAITSTGAISATGSLTAGNLITGGTMSASGNISGANITAVGRVNAAADISTTGNVLAQTTVSAVGNIITDAFFIGAFQGSIVGNIVGAPGSNTQVLFNTNGNVDAVGGMTYNKGSNVLTVLGVITAQGNIISTGNISVTRNATIGGNISIGANTTIGGNLAVAGTTALSGLVTAPNPVTGTANNQVATTAFVNNQINQYANNVAITGGTITVTSLNASTSMSTAGNVSSALLNLPTWTFREISGALYFQRSGVNIAKLDSSGNFTTIGNVTGFGTL
jgi:hypothetical protein